MNTVAIPVSESDAAKYGPDAVCWIDGILVREGATSIRNGYWRGISIYYLGNPNDLSRLAGPDDSFWGDPGEISGGSFQVAGGTLRFYSAESWNLPCNPKQAIEELEEIRLWCKDLAGKMVGTAAGAAVAVCKNIEPEHYGSESPRVAVAGHSGTFVGPILHARGGAVNAIEIDRNQAYLTAMEDFETPQFGLTSVRYGGNIDGIPGSSLVYATVWVDSRLNIPILPARYVGNVILPVGYVTGVWTAAYLKWALSNGASNPMIHGSIVPSKCGPMLRFRGAISGLPKHAAKGVYTRLWGRACTLGGWRGKKRGSSDDVSTVWGNGLQWVKQERSPLENPVQFYRPMLSAWITQHNYMRTIAAANHLKSGSVCLMHVDAIWTEDITGAKKIAESPAWKVVREGPLRTYAHGVYKHCDHIGAMGGTGQEIATMSDTDLAELAETAKVVNAGYRKWKGNPNVDIKATSVPIFIDGQTEDAIFLSNPNPFESHIWDESGDVNMHGTKKGEKTNIWWKVRVVPPVGPDFKTASIKDGKVNAAIDGWEQESGEIEPDSVDMVSGGHWKIRYLGSTWNVYVEKHSVEPAPGGIQWKV